MKCFFVAVISISLFLTKITAYSQSFLGYDAATYSGVYGVLNNPADILDHRVRADINLFGFSASAKNNIITLATNEKEADDAAQFPKNITKKGAFNFQSDVFGPSLMMRLSDKHAFAITTRFRTQANADKLGAGVLNLSLQDDVSNLNNIPIKISDASIQSHAWNELAFTYSRQVAISDFGVWKAALSLKILGGQGAAYATSNNLQFNYNDSLLADTVQHISYGGAVGVSGNINVNYAGFMDEWSDNYRYHFFQQPGVGLDIGINYEYRDAMQVYETAYNENTANYKWKAGVSVTDIGSIKYHSSPNSARAHFDGQTYLFNDLQVPVDSTAIQQVMRFYKTKFNAATLPPTFTMALPTTFHLQFDYSFNKWLSAKAHLSVPVKLSQVPYYTGTHTSPFLSVTPRAELPWVGIYFPMTYQYLSGFQLGGALRLGPLVIGTGSGITTGLLRKTKGADFYFILRIPFFGYRDYESEDIPPAHTKLGKLGRLIFGCPRS